MLRREGFMINHKRTERIYRQEGLILRIRRRKKMSSLLRTDIPKPELSQSHLEYGLYAGQSGQWTCHQGFVRGR